MRNGVLLRIPIPFDIAHATGKKFTYQILITDLLKLKTDQCFTWIFSFFPVHRLPDNLLLWKAYDELFEGSCALLLQ